jgi:multimeric flavodoxin WrbA
MKIGIMVYSMTGHTLSVATELQEALSVAGQDVHLEQLRVAGPVHLGTTDVPLETVPEIEPYDALVFATPVRGGTPAPPMASYLAQLPSLQGKRVACLVTGVFPAGWGRNQTLAQMAETCTSKGATVCGSASVWWWSLRRRKQIAAAVDDLASCLRRSAGWTDQVPS